VGFEGGRGGGGAQGIWGNLFLGNDNSKISAPLWMMIGCMPSGMTRGRTSCSLNINPHPGSPRLLPTGQLLRGSHAAPSRCALDLAFIGLELSLQLSTSIASANLVCSSFPLVGREFLWAFFLGVCEQANR
jgi:hypothetical protein